MPKTYIGIDIGKTKTAVLLASESGEILRKKVVRTDLSEGASVPEQMFASIREISVNAKSEVEAIGISAIGVVDAVKGVVRMSSIPSLNGLEIVKVTSEEFGLPVIVDNDLHCPAYGEYAFGAGRGSPLMVYLTISSGSGISTIRNGRIERGFHNLAGFLGPANTLRDGTALESIFSGGGISSRASVIIGRATTTEEAFRLAKVSPGPLRDLIRDAEYYGATVVATIQAGIDPERIVVGGTVASKQPEFLDNIKRLAEEMLSPVHSQLPSGINMVASELGLYNGALGAAAMAMQRP